MAAINRPLILLGLLACLLSFCLSASCRLLGPRAAAAVSWKRQVPKWVVTSANQYGFNYSVITGVYNGTLIATMNGKNVGVNGTAKGDLLGRGQAALVLFSNNGDYSVGIFADALFSDIGAPTGIAVFQAAAGGTGPLLLDLQLSTTGSVTPWFNTTVAFNTALAAAIKQYPFLAYFFPNVLYQYVTANFWFKAGNKVSPAGGTAADVIKSIIANPAGYYVQVTSAAYPSGAVRGQFSKY